MKQLARKVLLGLIGAFFSEVLFTYMIATALFVEDPFSLAIYFFLFALMDEVVEHYNLRNRAVFYLGAIFGLGLEGFFVATIPEAPFFFIPFISIAWHGLITVLATFIVVDLLLPRAPYRPLHKGWLLFSAGGAFCLFAFMSLYTLPIILFAFPVYLVVVACILFFSWLLFLEIKKKAPYRLRPMLGVGLLVAGFILGALLQFNEAEASYHLADHILRAILFSAILIPAMIGMMKKPAFAAAKET